MTLAAFALIRDLDGKILLLHRVSQDLWNLPGGRVESGESPWDAVVREIAEETQCTAVVTRLAGVYHKPERDELSFFFECQVTGGELARSTNETDDAQYFDIQSMPTNLSPKQRERIIDAINQPTKVVLKEQTGPRSVDLVAEGKL